MFEGITKNEELREKYQKLLLEKRVLVLAGGIDKETIASLKVFLLLLSTQSKEEITLYIDSPGGHCGLALQLCDVIRVCGAPVKGIVIGECMSSAVYILQACQKRAAAKHSCFFIHAEWSIQGGNEEKMKKQLEEATKSWKMFRELLAQRTGRSPEEIEEKKMEEKVMSAEEAKEFGLIDEII